MKIKWSLDIKTGAVERGEAARALRLAGATVVGPVTRQVFIAMGTNLLVEMQSIVGRALAMRG